MINHVPWNTIYGAGTSLRLHWYILQPDIIGEKISVSIFTRIGLLGLLTSNKRNFDGVSNFKDFRRLVFALDQNYDYESVRSDVLVVFWRTVSRCVNRIVELLSLLYLVVFCKIHRYDIIHFNSHVLVSAASRLAKLLGSSKPRMIMHVRDFLARGLSPQERGYFNDVDTFICIDYSTQSRLIEELGSAFRSKSVVIQNPFRTAAAGIFFDMGRYHVPFGKKVFAIVGAVISDKGVIKTCRSFVKAEISDSVLVVVGNGEDVDDVVSICDNSMGRVFYLGEVPNLVDTGFFASIDYLVRGDSTFRTGRTVYEALYAGKIVILPGNQEDLDNDKNLAKFSEKVFFYDPLSEDGLLKSFKSVSSSISLANENISCCEGDNFNTYRDAVLTAYGIANS